MGGLAGWVQAAWAAEVSGGSSPGLSAELRGHPVTRVGQVIAELSPKDTGNVLVSREPVPEHTRSYRVMAQGREGFSQTPRGQEPSPESLKPA